MKKRLTLTIEERTIKKAKGYAKNSNQSLSQLIENHLRMLTDETRDRSHISPKLLSIIGVVKLPCDFDERFR